jgi:hypothetical protein
MYALKGLGVPAFNVHVILGCLLFIDRTYYRERIFNTNVITAFVLFSAILNTERNAHNTEELRLTPVVVFSNAIWNVVGVLALLRAHVRVRCLRAAQFNPLIAACVLLVVHSFLYWPRENEVLLVCRIFDFFLLTVTWIYLFNAHVMKPNEVYNATDCIVQFGHVLFTGLVASGLATVVYLAIFFLMSRRHIRAGIDTASKLDFSDDDEDIEAVPLSIPVDTEQAQAVEDNSLLLKQPVHKPDTANSTYADLKPNAVISEQERALFYAARAQVSESDDLALLQQVRANSRFSNFE